MPSTSNLFKHNYSTAQFKFDDHVHLTRLHWYIFIESLEETCMHVIIALVLIFHKHVKELH